MSYSDINISSSIRKIIGITSWNRSSKYANSRHIRDLEPSFWSDSITISAKVMGTHSYQTQINLFQRWEIWTACSCPAHTAHSGCKHVGALARTLDALYTIDADTFVMMRKSDQTNIGQPSGITPQTHPKNLDQPPVFPYRVKSEFRALFPSNMDPDDSEVITVLYRTNPEIFERIETEWEEIDDESHEWIETVWVEKRSRSLSLLDSLAHSENLSDESRKYYRIKIGSVPERWSSIEKNDLYLVLHEAKLLKNGKISVGQILYRDSIRDPEVLAYRPFARPKPSYYYNGEPALSFRAAPETFIRLLQTWEYPLSHLDNTPLSITPGLASISLHITEQKWPKPYQITAQLQSGSVKTLIPAKSRLIAAPQTDIFWLFSENRSRLTFLRSSLPASFLSAIITKPLALSRSEWWQLRQLPAFEALLDRVDSLDFLDGEIIDISPQLRLTIEITPEYSEVIVSYDFLYEGVRVHPRSEKKIIPHAGKLIRRNFWWENLEYTKTLPLLDLSTHHDEENARIIRVIDEDSDIFFDTIEILLSEGILIEYRQPTKRISTAPLSAKVQVSSEENWFDLSVEMILGDTVLSNAVEILRAMRKWGQYLTLDNGTVIRLKQEIRQTLSEWDELGIDERNISSKIRLDRSMIGLLKSGWDSISQYDLPSEVQKLQKSLESFTGIESRPTPSSATVTLRDYQQRWYDWLHFLHSYHFSGILADDMGLGKTIQTLVFLESLYRESEGDWETSKKQKKWKWSKSTRIPPYPPSQGGSPVWVEKRPSLIVVPTSLVLNWMDEAQKFVPSLRVAYVRDGKTGLSDIPAETEVIIISYGILANLIDRADFSDRSWYYVILDEAQNIKNSKSDRARAIYQLSSVHRLALSGTPLENNLMELQSIFHFLMPGFIGNESRFRDRYTKGDTANLRLLSAKVKPFILRRTKESVLTELPPKQESIIHLDMGAEQRKFYTDLKTTYQAQISKQLEEKGFAQSQFAVLDALLKLRQACLTPALVPLSGNTVTASAKLDYLEENIEEMINNGHSLLIFSQFTGFLAHVRSLLDRRSIIHNYLDGQTKREERKKLVESFNAGSCKVFLISLKAGGVGLNLTGADYVIHLDPWWNPAVESQATDRAHRMGQQKTVFVEKLILRDTVEEKILHLQDRKKKLIDDLFSGDFRGNLSEEDVKWIFE